MVGKASIESDGLSDGDIGEVEFLRIGVDPWVVEVDDTEYRRAGGNEAAELDVVDLCRDAIHRRAQHGVVEVALGIVQLGLGLRVGREFLERQIGIAEQLGLGSWRSAA